MNTLVRIMAKIKYSKNTEQYWKDRYNLKESLGDRTEAEMLNHLRELYKNATMEIDKEIQAFYGRYAYNNDLSLSEVKKRLNSQELKSAKQEIAKYYSDIDRLARKANGEVSVKLLRKYKKQLRLQSAKAYMSRLEDLKIRIQNTLVNLGVDEDNTLFKSLSKTSKKAYTKSAYNLSKYMGFGNTFSDKQFEKIVNERWLGENYSDRVWENKEYLENELEKTFLQGVVRGQNPRKIAEEMQKNMGGAYYRCERLARTEMIHTFNESTMESYKDYGIKQYQFVCGLDERTCPECGELDGQVFEIKDKIEGVNYPVIHPNCVLPDNIVFSPDAEKMTRSYYSGDVIKVRTSKGGWFSVTPNHIMLTSRGWVRAKNLVKSDKVIRYVNWDKFVKNPTNDNSIPTIENLFTSFSKLPFVLTETMESTSKDFKGDVIENTKIDIININSLLRNKINVPFVKFISDFKFILTRKFGKRIFPRNSTMAKFLMCIGFASDGIMSIDSILSVFFRSSFTHHKLIGLRSSSDYNSRLNKSIINNGSCDIKDFSKFVNACSSIIQFDDVIDVQISNFSGHVYDFSSISTLYICNGYLFSNCRCTTIPYFEDLGDESTRVAYTENHDIYEVPANMTYTEWVEKFNTD